MLKKIKFIYFCLFIISLEVRAQDYVLDYTLGNFNSASAFSITSSGFIYIADDGDNSLIKLDTLGNEVKEIGGYGWSSSAFDTPVDVFANTLNILVCDKQNHRVQAFDKDLNFISELYTRESENPDERFGYPLSCALSSMGDLYVLDSENIRVLKFDLFGNFIQNFGGFDWGIYSLNHPKRLTVNFDNSVLVLDDTLLIVYDQFGNGKEKINLNKTFTGLRIYAAGLILSNELEIYIVTFGTSENTLTKLNLIGIPEDFKIISCYNFNGKFYILSPHEIFVFIKK